MPFTHLTLSLQGVITVKGLVDREKGDFYTLTVVADDGDPKVDSTVVSGSPAESLSAPQGACKPTPSAGIQHVGWAVGEGFNSLGVALWPAMPRPLGQPGPRMRP